MSAAANNNGGGGDTPPVGDINVTSAYPRLPIPPLTENAVEAYFMSLDFWFAASGVTNDLRKYNTVMAQVPPTKLLELTEIVRATPANGKYDYIKTQLIQHFTDSQTKRLQRVLSDMPLGDKKPSQLYHDMARVAGTALDETALRDLWAARLPTYTQAAVVAARGTLAEVLQTADRVNESLGLRQSQVSSAEAVPTPPSEMALLVQQINETFRKFTDEFARERRSRSRSRDRSQSRSQQRDSRSTTPNDGDECWYHEKYGRNARQCRSPCSWRRPPTSTPASSGASSNKQ